mmetsp:Transcript_7249/g.15677  ORF Transcript_7249/g.15677 Transcript_7249/m.15677 type:complete len:138 (-) Transcript_7249:208-621(-)
MAPEPEKEITMEEVSKHNTTEDCWIVIGNDDTGGPKVYDITTYLDDHPGGSEVLLDVAGKDGDEFFEDIGHSNDARDELKKHMVGVLKLTPEEIEQRRLDKENKSGGGGGGGMGVVAVVVAAVAAAYFYYKNSIEES